MADESSELEEETRKPGRACEGSRHDLIKCLRESDCVRVEGRTPKECLMRGSSECEPLRVAFFECKRSLLDNRVRFRGRKGY